MGYIYRQVTETGTEPVTVAEAKLHLRLIQSDTSEDDLITRLIKTAREYCEGYTSKSFVTKTVVAYPDGAEEEILLPLGPVASITSVKVTDSTGVQHTLVSGTDYIADMVKETVSLKKTYIYAERNPIEITYTAGSASVPEAVKQAILLLVGHWYENREDILNEPIASVASKKAANTLLNMYRARWF